MEGITKGTPLKKSTRKSLEEAINAATKELGVVKSLKRALINYLLIDDYIIEDDNSTGFCLILGRVELSIHRRIQMREEDERELFNLPHEK